jgi:hypothetical protein
MTPIDGQPGQYDEEDFEQASRLVKSRQFFHRKPKKAADLIAQLMARKGYNQSTAVDELKTAWEAIGDRRWVKQTQPGNIRKGVLEVMVANSALLQQLQFARQNLVTALQQQLPQNKIKDIRFRIGTVKHNE